mmetsp:Transcript_21972/g.25963  ORF Transcript_21972/g.25963 Transcript_21972/m.25963 type:complete len:90 (+) Transcript_21972:99-368(+)|eukprot:Skav232279  [mRNA]  locus=scaffold882:250057:259737:- [translate_table: standard]
MRISQGLAPRHTILPLGLGLAPTNQPIGPVTSRLQRLQKLVDLPEWLSYPAASRRKLERKAPNASETCAKRYQEAVAPMRAPPLARPQD